MGKFEYLFTLYRTNGSRLYHAIKHLEIYYGDHLDPVRFINDFETMVTNLLASVDSSDEHDYASSKI